MSTAIAYPILVFYGPEWVFLSATYLAHKRLFLGISFAGVCSRKRIVYGVGAISIAYLATMAPPREPSIVRIYRFKTNFQVAVLIVSLLLLPPVVEELALRHFILSALRSTPAYGCPAWQ